MARDGNNYHYNSGLQSMYLIKTPIPGIGDCQVSSVGPNSGAVHPDILPMRAVISFAMLSFTIQTPLFHDSNAMLFLSLYPLHSAAHFRRLRHHADEMLA